MKLVNYMTKESSRLPTGMYLGLFHGRKDPNQQMDDWGRNGPMIPIKAMHTTYCNIVRVQCLNAEDAAQVRALAGSSDAIAENDWVEILVENEMLKFDNKWYGDWTVFMHTKGEKT